MRCDASGGAVVFTSAGDVPGKNVLQYEFHYGIVLWDSRVFIGDRGFTRRWSMGSEITGMEPK
jgi:hypothetical protein